MPIKRVFKITKFESGDTNPTATKKCQIQYYLPVQQDRRQKKVITSVSIAIEIGATDISSYGGELGDQDALRREWGGTATQLPLFCNCRFTGIRADGAHFGSCATRGGVRLLFAFYTGSSDLGFPRSPL